MSKLVLVLKRHKKKSKYTQPSMELPREQIVERKGRQVKFEASSSTTQTGKSMKDGLIAYPAGTEVDRAKKMLRSLSLKKFARPQESAKVQAAEERIIVPAFRRSNTARAVMTEKEVVVAPKRNLSTVATVVSTIQPVEVEVTRYHSVEKKSELPLLKRQPALRR